VILHVPELIVRPRSFLGVVGPNGAGKTTLLGVCAGLIAPTSGQATLTGRRLDGLSSWQRTHLRRRVGLVPQRADYNPDVPLSVREVVSLGRVGPRGLLRTLTGADEALVDTWLATLGLTELAGRTFRSLSGGEQQKVLVARAMVQEPRLLLLDEPTANLDLDWKQRVVALLEKLYAEHPLTVVMVSHDTALLPRCTTEVALLSAGELLEVGPPQEVLTAANLSRMYGCAVEVVTFRGGRHAVAVVPEEPERS